MLGPVSSPLLSRWQPEQERTPWLMVVSINTPTIDLPGLQKKIKRILFPAFITDSERGNVVGRSLTPDLCSQGLLPWIHSRTAKTLQIWVRSLIGCPDNRETSLCYVGGPDFHLVSSCQQTDHWPKRKSERAEASEKSDGNCCLEDANVHVSGKRKHWLHSTENQ